MGKQSEKAFRKVLEKQTLDAIKILTIYNHRRDMAVGLSLSKRTKGMAWYGIEMFTRTQQELVKAATVKVMLEKIRTRMQDITKEAETADTTRRRDLLIEARGLQRKARKVSKNG